MKNKNVLIILMSIFIGSTGLLAVEGTAQEDESFRVSAIVVRGNVNVKEKEILKAIKTKAMDNYSQEKIKDDVKNIQGLGYFEDVTAEVSTYTHRVLFSVVEKPLIKKIDFRGNKVLSNGKIKGEISNKKGEYMDKLKLNEDTGKILDLYSEKGYADTDVTYDTVIDKTANQVNLTFFINEGRKVVTEAVVVDGTKVFKAKKIAGLMKTKAKKIYKEKILSEDIKAINSFYKERGFESVEVSTPLITFNEDRTKVRVTLTVSEGVKYRLGNIAFDGNTVYTEKELVKALDIKSGQLYSQSRLDTSVQGISELYSDKGYLQASVVPEINKFTERGIIDVQFAIVENNVAYLGKVYVDGLNYTKEYVIRREILLKEEEPFSGVKLRKSLEKIYNLGFIDDVNVDLEKTDTPDTVDLVLNVTEGKPGMLQAGAGYSSVDQLVGSLQVNHLNLFGKAQRLNVLWEFGARKNSYQIGWTEPWFMQKPVTFGVNLYDTDRQIYFGNDYAYRQHRQGVDFQLGPRFSEQSSLWFTYSYEKINNSEVQPTYVDTVTSGPALTSSLTVKYDYDTRDNIFNPTKGNHESASLQLAGGPFGGDVDFYKPILKSSWFFPTIWDFIFSVNGTLGWVQGTQGYQLKDPTYKFYVGGSDSVRGYLYNDLTPGDVNSRQGSKVMFVGNVEYKFPIVKEKRKTILQGAFFYDFGGGWDSFDDMFRGLSVGETDLWRNPGGTWDGYMKAGWGFGIRFTTPVFPIRLDWGWPLQPIAGRSAPEFYFTIGQLF